MTRLAGKVTLITGAGRGIGKAIALAFAREGAAIAALDLKADVAAATAAEIARAGGRAIPIAANVADRAAIIAAVGTARQAFGEVDTLINNAMWVRYAPIETLAPEAVDRMIDTGFKSIVWGIQAVVPGMTRLGGGAIVNIASAAAHLGIPNGLVYSGVKAGVLGLTRAAAAELGPKRIRVTAICPGFVPTEGVAANVSAEAQAKRLARTPLGRLGTVEDIAQAALFLASDQASFITGDFLLVDGGTTHALL